MAMHFFLGANSAGGFLSLYPHLRKEGRRLYVLKAGPGCGKATCIRALSDGLGGADEYIHCSSDPDSLDGAVLEGRAILDGTAPHVEEPTFPGSDGDYITLPPLLDREGLAQKDGELYALKAASGAHYQGAYRLLAAAQKAREERRQTAAALLTGPGPEKRAAGLLQREVPRQEGPGRERRRFLEGFTPKGYLRFDQTVEACADRVIALQDSFGLGEPLLEALRAGALERGQTVYACMDPLEPQRLRHLLLPDCRLAFVTREGRDALRATRAIRVDGMLSPEGLRQARARLRLLAKVEEELLEEAVEHLAAAHALHDRIEAIYRPHVDVAAMAAWYQTLLERMG